MHCRFGAISGRIHVGRSAADGVASRNRKRRRNQHYRNQLLDHYRSSVDVRNDTESPKPLFVYLQF
jgi:hypothetical protein